MLASQLVQNQSRQTRRRHPSQLQQEEAVWRRQLLALSLLLLLLGMRLAAARQLKLEVERQTAAVVALVVAELPLLTARVKAARAVV